ncbi:MAG TPA: hypothetical protein VGH16_18560 [Candidatus Binatia bacterium]|jgi:hypothetical protein
MLPSGSATQRQVARAARRGYFDFNAHAKCMPKPSGSAMVKSLRP